MFSVVLEIKNSRNCCFREHSTVFSSQTPGLMTLRTVISLTSLSRECKSSTVKSSFRDVSKFEKTYSQLRGARLSNTANDASNYHLLSPSSITDCLVQTVSLNPQKCYSRLTDNWNFGWYLARYHLSKIRGRWISKPCCQLHTSSTFLATTSLLPIPHTAPSLRS